MDAPLCRISLTEAHLLMGKFSCRFNRFPTDRGGLTTAIPD